MTDLVNGSTEPHPAADGEAAYGDALESRAPLPAIAVPGAMVALMALDRAVSDSGLAPLTRELVHIRASQLNGCGVCLVQHPRAARGLGETDERIWAVAGWRDAPYFSPAERAALALAEAMTTLSDHPGDIPEVAWQAASTISMSSSSPPWSSPSPTSTCGTG